jgi:hypothetical protein
MAIGPLSRVGIAGALVAGTVAIHSAGSFFLIWLFKKRRTASAAQPGYAGLTAGLTGVVLCLLLLHLLECGLWAAFFYLGNCFSSVYDAVYFSLITYATVGYGDVVLSSEWRLLGGVEALAGVMMMSWSTAILIGFVQSVYSRDLR